MRRMIRKIFQMALGLYNHMGIPFAIIHVRAIQYLYKHISIKYSSSRSTPRSSYLILLLAKEYYYKEAFSAWGKYHPDFVFNEKQYIKHHQFLNWLFPVKDFPEWETVVWHKPEAITYYHNKIWTLSDGMSYRYDKEINKQIKECREEELNRYHNE